MILKKKKQLILLISSAFALLLIISVVLIVQIGGNKKMSGKYEKILVLGIDGTDPKVMNKLMGEGKLPNFEKLNFKELQTVVAPQSPIAWASIATGMNPGKHNIFDFIRRDSKKYLPLLSLAKSVSGLGGTKYESYVRGTPFWKTTSRAGISTTVIRWPLTFPSDKVKGNLLSGLGVPDIKGLLSGYSYYTSASFDPNEEGGDKTIKVDIKGDTIKTNVLGPKKKTSSGITSIESPLEIKLLDNSAKIIVDGKEYGVEVNGWSEWIRFEFKFGLMKKVTGIARAHLISVKPDFNMFLSTIEVDPENPVYDISYPKSYSKELAEKIGLYHTLGIAEDTKAFNDGKLNAKSFMQHVNHIGKERDAMFWEEFNNFNEGILAFVYDDSDRIQHMFWDHKALEGEEFSISPEIERYFLEKDKLIGEILAKIDDKTAFMILSDHGFDSFERSVEINTWLYENGYMQLSRQVTKDSPGELFQFVEWGGTKAYSVGFSGIYLNMKGREGQGIVEESEKEALMDEIIAKLKELKDPKNNKLVVKEVYKASEIYSGDYVHNSPDLVIGFNRGYRMGWISPIGGVAIEIFDDNKKEWKADHIVDPSLVPGTLFTNFKINRENPRLIDINPTILSLAGLEIPEDVDGESLVG